MTRFFSRFLLALALLLGPAYVLPALADNDHLNQPKDVSAVTVTTTATKLMASPDPARRHRGVFIQPTNGTVYLGGPSVTSSTGLPVTSGTTVWIEWTTGDRWFARAASGTVDVRVVPVF